MDHWPPLLLRGQSFLLDHLSSRMLTCLCLTGSDQRDLSILVRFSCHFFTERFIEDLHDTDLVYWDHKQKRTFCQERYDLSRLLPDIIDALPEQRVHQTAEARNYAHFVLVPQIEGRAYQVYLTLKKSRAAERDLLLFVESAYASLKAPNLRKRPNGIRFRMLAQKTFRGEKIRFAPR